MDYSQSFLKTLRYRPSSGGDWTERAIPELKLPDAYRNEASDNELRPLGNNWNNESYYLQTFSGLTNDVEYEFEFIVERTKQTQRCLGSGSGSFVCSPLSSSLRLPVVISEKTQTLKATPRAKPKTFAITRASRDDQSISLEWSASTDATRYVVCAALSSTDSTWQNCSTDDAGRKTTDTSLEIDFEEATETQTAYIRILALNDYYDTAKVGTFSDVISLADGAAPSTFTVTATPGNGSVSLSWGTESGATYTGSYKTSGTTSSTAFSIATAGTASVSGLTNGTSYIFSVTATNAQGATTATATATPAAVANKKIFVTASDYATNLAPAVGGINAMISADFYCGSDSNKPDGNTYKALLVGTGRVACTTADCGGGTSEHNDWVMAASTTYYRADGTTVIGTTTANGIFAFPLTAAFSTAGTAMTGISTDWRNSADTCDDWKSATNAFNYSAGSMTATTSGAISASTVACDTAGKFICVEQ